jgi:SAM-dependent methyltransferase
VKKDYVPEINKPDIAEALDALYRRADYIEDAKRIVQYIPSSARKVLDAGCGTGRLAPYIQERGVEYVGIDPADLLLGKAKNNFPNLNFSQMNVLDLKFRSESFDGVLCINVLKHLHRHEVGKAFSEIVRVCRRGGTIIIRVPIIPETRSYAEYDDYITDQNLEYEDIAFHGSDILSLASENSITVVDPLKYSSQGDEPYTAPIIVLKKTSCKWLNVARLWRETLIEAELTWANLLDYTEVDLRARYREMSVKYDILVENLREIIDHESMGRSFWGFILSRLNTGKDVLSDLAEHGQLKERGFTAAMQRMDWVRRVQQDRKYPPQFIEEQQELYRKHWLEHPRLAFEVPKAILHEQCMTITSRVDDETIADLSGKPLTPDEKSLICTCVKNHFAFSRELAYQDPHLFTNLPNHSDEQSCKAQGCKYWRG